MKKLVFAGICLASSFSFASSNCHLKAANQTAFENDLKAAIALDNDQEYIDEIFSEAKPCHKILDIVASNDDAEIVIDGLINTMINHKISPKQMSSYDYLDVKMDNDSVSVPRKMLQSFYEDEFHIAKARLEKLAKHGIKLDHNSVSAYSPTQTVPSFREAYKTCEVLGMEACMENTSAEFVRTLYNDLKASNYNLTEADELAISSQLRAAGANAEEIAEVLQNVQHDAKLYYGTPLKQAAVKLDLELMKYLIADGADTTELAAIRNLLMEDIVLEVAAGYMTDDESLAPEREKRDAIIKFLDENYPRSIAETKNCVNGSLISESNQNILNITSRATGADELITKCGPGLKSGKVEESESPDGLAGAFDGIEPKTYESQPWQNLWDNQSKSGPSSIAE